MPAGRGRQDRLRAQATRREGVRAASQRSNQSWARWATCSRVPGSSKRWVAPGTMARRVRAFRRALAWRLRSRTAGSLAPTMSRTGAWTFSRAGPARSGRPPRETMAQKGRPCRGGNQGGGGAGTGAEAAEAEGAEDGVAADPLDGVEQAVGEQVDVEAEMGGALVEHLFRFGEQVKEERGEAGLLQFLGDELVAGTVAAAAAAVGEEHGGRRGRRGCAGRRGGGRRRGCRQRGSEVGIRG